MIPNNLMRFHENNTIISSLKEFTGSYLSIANTINAPIERLEISGVSNQTITVTGKNILDRSTIVSGGLVGSSGLEYANDTRARSGFFSITPATAYKQTFTSSTFSINSFHVYDANKVWLRQIPSNVTTTATAGAYYIRVHFQKIDNTTITGAELTALKAINMQLEAGSVATAYEAFIPNSPSPNYPSAITNVVNPVLTITDNITTHNTNLLGTLRSLPNGIKDKLVIDKTTQTAWIERNITTAILSSGTSWNIANAKANSLYRSTNLASGNLTGTTLTSAVTVPTSFEVDYELATPTIESIAYPSLETIQYLTNISTNSALNPSIKAKVKVLGS